MIENYKFWIAITTIIMAVYSYIPYFNGILKGETKPHLFMWIVWTILTLISVIIQILEGAGTGAWPTILTTCFCVFITLLALKYGTKNIKKIDWVFFIASLITIPVWIITKDPALSAVLAISIKLVASFPTIRKSWNYPEEEIASTYGINAFRHLLSIFALESFSTSTIAYPLGMVLLHGVIFLVLIIRSNINLTKILEDT